MLSSGVGGVYVRGDRRGLDGWIDVAVALYRCFCCNNDCLFVRSLSLFLSRSCEAVSVRMGGLCRIGVQSVRLLFTRSVLWERGITK